MIDGPVGDLLGGLKTMGRSIEGRYSLRIDGAEAGSESWMMRRTAPGVRIEATVELARPVQLCHRLELDLEADWRPRRLQVAAEGADALRSGEFRIGEAGWTGQVREGDGEDRSWDEVAVEDGAPSIFDFGATVIHFNTLWMRRRPGDVEEVTALVIAPDLEPSLARQTHRFLRHHTPRRRHGDGARLLHQSIVTELDGRTVFNHCWTADNGVPVRTVVATAEALFEAALVEYRGPRSAALSRAQART